MQINTTTRQAEIARRLRPVRLWLQSVILLLIIMVLVGGATRLTDSGLSITEWAPIRGVLPPFSQAQWMAEFAKYQTTTEFASINFNMTLAEFKPIYWWEWGHRFLGRLIGLVVVVPLVWFWVRGRLNSWLKPRLLLLLAMGASQGFIGWWMVQSGLVDRVDVSQIRLAVHLTMAFVIFAFAIWITQSLRLHTGQIVHGYTGIIAGLTVLALVQVFFGGLLAGMDGGMIHNTWPDMSGSFVPEGIGAAGSMMDDLTGNATTIQFVHRMLAYALAFGVLAHTVHVVAREPSTPHARRAIVLTLIVIMQASVGIVTLVQQVPVEWALLHQFGGLLVVAALVVHWRGLKPKDLTSL